jgi:hypothetical protein
MVLFDLFWREMKMSFHRLHFRLHLDTAAQAIDGPSRQIQATRQIHLALSIDLRIRENKSFLSFSLSSTTW